MNYPEIGTPERRKLDLRMMKDPTHWPYRVLPLKRIREGHGDMGYLKTAGAEVLPVVFQDGGPDRRYGSMESILDDGWTVD